MQSVFIRLLIYVTLLRVTYPCITISYYITRNTRRLGIYPKQEEWTIRTFKLRCINAVVPCKRNYGPIHKNGTAKMIKSEIIHIYYLHHMTPEHLLFREDKSDLQGNKCRSEPKLTIFSSFLNLFLTWTLKVIDQILQTP